MRVSLILFFGLLCVTLLAGSSASGAEIVVTPGPGAIAAAIAKSVEGDTLRLGKGVYAESVVINKRIALVGGPGVVIDSSEAFKPEWKPAAKIGAGVYRAAVTFRPRTLFLDGKIVAEIDAKEAAEEGPWNWKTLFAKGPPRAGFKYLLAVWMYHPGEKAVYLRAPDSADPAKLNLTCGRSNDPAIRFRDVDGASVSDLTIANAHGGVSFGESAKRCVLTRCVIGPWDKTGVSLGGGASENIVEHNQIFRGALEDWIPHADNARERYEIWQLHKSVGYSDRVGVNLLRAGHDNIIRQNHIYETFDGIDLGDYSIESLDKPLTSPEDGKGTIIANNLIERTRDSGIELGAGCIDVQVYGNILRQTHGGLRFKLPRIGPVFIHHNVLEDGSPFNIWFSIDDSPARGYVYHNTIVGGSAGLTYSSFVKPHNIGAPNWHFVNNLVMSKNGFFSNRKTEAPVNFTADYNVVTGDHRPWPGEPAKDAHSKYVDKLELGKDLRPLPDSPAMDAGLDLSKYLDGKPLPGCLPGYFMGQAPDAGAFEVK